MATCEIHVIAILGPEGGQGLGVATLKGITVHRLTISLAFVGYRLHQSARAPGRRSVGPDHATKTYMAGAGVDHLRMPSGRTVAPAVVRRTEIRAALDHLARNTAAGLCRVIAESLKAALRVARHAARPLGSR